MTNRIAQLEVKRHKLHEYILMKLEERDYHGVADAAMDLREIDREVRVIEEFYKEYKDLSSNFGLSQAQNQENK